MFVIGDVHGKINRYLDILDTLKEEPSIQLGDMGIGFKGVHLPTLAAQHKFFRGNHDHPLKSKAHPNYLGDYGYIEEESLFYVSGAWSIDKAWRTPGIDWWPEEELSIVELNEAINLYVEKKPRIMVTHDAPEVAAYEMIRSMLIGGPRNPNYATAPKGIISSRTTQALQQMFQLHKPKQWVFGHWHLDKEFVIDGTKFTCLGELSVKEFTLSPHSSIGRATDL